MSRSTWACELKLYRKAVRSDIRLSRSTWACELKWKLLNILRSITRHAPRERVSWNSTDTHTDGFFTESRSTWACELKLNYYEINLNLAKVTLHVSVWVEMRKRPWNVHDRLGHAPRERVSWNNQDSRGKRVAYVTLHVSVWVEIQFLPIFQVCLMSRSTWACELKCLKISAFNCSFVSRSTWACELKSS